MTIAGVKRGLAERRERLRRLAGQVEAEGGVVSIDADVLAKFRATGPDWQARINDALRAAEI